MANVIVEAKVVGRKRPVFSDWHIPLPPDVDGRNNLTLRDLITTIVLKEVDAFKERQEKRRLAQVLSKDEIVAGAERGKIDMGERDLQQEVDSHAAVAHALQAFEDGIYYVFLDDVQQDDLDAQVSIADESRILFVRLVALAGG